MSDECNKTAAHNDTLRLHDALIIPDSYPVQPTIADATHNGTRTLEETLAPPTMHAMGRTGLSTAPWRYLSSFSMRNPDT